jgi:hypothetical protein
VWVNIIFCEQTVQKNDFRDRELEILSL